MEKTMSDMISHYKETIEKHEREIAEILRKAETDSERWKGAVKYKVPVMKVEVESNYIPHEQKVTVTLTRIETGKKVSDWARATSGVIAQRVVKQLIDQLKKVL